MVERFYSYYPRLGHYPTTQMRDSSVYFGSGRPYVEMHVCI